jgi:hypothetical protein
MADMSKKFIDTGGRRFVSTRQSVVKESNRTLG